MNTIRKEFNIYCYSYDMNCTLENVIETIITKSCAQIGIINFFPGKKQNVKITTRLYTSIVTFITTYTKYLSCFLKCKFC